MMEYDQHTHLQTLHHVKKIFTVAENEIHKNETESLANVNRINNLMKTIKNLDCLTW